MANLFVYGSLLFSEIAEQLCGQKIKTANAALKGYARFALKGADYPAMIKKQNSLVYGKVLLNLTPEAVELLTFYEGNEYEIRPLRVELANEKKINAFGFLWTGGDEYLEAFDWDKKHFELESLQFYVDDVIPSTLDTYRNEKKST
ncbi:gamma-glutamylcyclotransferase family protein [uncultured Draconibacterium sp.]|uniref:gamma-glutamylcyclotransferase family protein n=1 Tax=uncultured Draconibacterium sp. TaxID=1573823 RepID=UPI0032617EF6